MDVGPVSAHLQQLVGKADGDDAGGAAHAAQVVGQHIRPHLEVVHQHRAAVQTRHCSQWVTGVVSQTLELSAALTYSTANPCVKRPF